MGRTLSNSSVVKGDVETLPPATNIRSDAFRLRELAAEWGHQPELMEIVQRLRAGSPVTIDHVVGGARSLLAAALLGQVPSQLVLITPQAKEIEELEDELALFTDQPLAAFVPWEVGVGERELADEIYSRRLRVLKELSGGGPAPRLLITSIQSWQQPVTSREGLVAHERVIRVGDVLDGEALRGWLVEQGFQGTAAVEMPGEFAWRGGILDLFAPAWSEPVRIEFFGDEVSSLRTFTVETQRSTERIDQIEIALLASTERDREQATSFLGEYLARDAWILLLEPENIHEQARQYQDRTEGRDLIFSADDVLARLHDFPLALAAGLASGGWEETVQLPVESVERFSGEVGRVREELEGIAAGREVTIVTQTEAEVERLQELFASSETARQSRLQFTVGHLTRGFSLPTRNQLLLSGNDLFHRTVVKRDVRRPVRGKALDSFLDLRAGDLVVHLSHGIGRYLGLQLLDREGQAEEHLTVEFDAGVKIYVPASRIHLVQKYVGGSKGRPKLAKIGGKSWVKQKQAAQAAVRDVAADMLELQASRSGRPGIPFAADSEWQREFDAAFPYEETTDQLHAITAIKHDMELGRPMDRLLCGDVGFGKTELAMRAAFKAVESGYQVAVLVPTTVLVEQHYRNFCERMAEFPLHIAKLSRFGTLAEQREVVRGMASGSVDIVIGTHRLASKDIRFDNLGLVIIDEEQRFGVDVKERLKTLRSSVDVLTMTATPIPRTLHMSLVGVRDISNLETPPQERVAVETKVTRWTNEVIRHAVIRELNRGGQIYFVHNRVQDIHVVATKLRQIVPEVRIGIAHGQLPEDELECVMVDFLQHEIDLLLATTIVESGLDIPNANTIFIDEADCYGLADLHQLRGRVGRSSHRAYCYLLLDPRKSITPQATKRLHAIEEFSEMGAGFAISMRDLEIRGAGNLLGNEQSGHIAAVGYELYCQLLEDAVRQQRRLPPKLTMDVEINLPVRAFLPDEFVGDMRLKIDLYRRLSRVSSDAELTEFFQELQDRFGPLPPPVEGLRQLAEIRLDAAFWQISTIFVEDHLLGLHFSDRQRLKVLGQQSGHTFRVVDGQTAYVPLPGESLSDDGLVWFAKSVLRAS